MTDVMETQLDPGPPLVAQGWRALLALIGEPTSDGRVFDELTWRELPLSLLWQPENLPGHEGAVVVGRIDSIIRDENQVWGSGPLDTGSQAGNEVARLIGEKFLRGISVDAAVLDMSEGADGMMHFRGEIGAATVVSFPAFAQAEIELTDLAPEGTADDDAEELAASGSTSLPIADRGRAWDGPGAEKRVRAWAGADEAPNAKYGQAFFVVDGDKTKFGSYHLGFADVIGGTLTAIPRGVFAAAAAVQGSRGASNPAFGAAKPKIATYYRRIAQRDNDKSLKPPWASAVERVIDVGLGVGLIASGVPQDAPPREWFMPPSHDKRYGLHIEEDGRVWGHLYGWGECHVGSPPGQCVRLSRDALGFSYMVDVDGRGVRCADGSFAPTGPLCVAADHADLSFGWMRAKDHYAHTGLVWADAVIGADEHGIWVAGAVRPGVAPEVLRAAAGSVPSVDCRPIGGRLEVVAVLSVNMGGFPAVPRPRMAARFEEGRIMALVASGAAVAADCGCGSHEALDAALARLAALETDLAPYREEQARQRAEELASLETELGLDRASLVAALEAELGGC